MYDIIGDIHGHASVLKELLNKLGYEKQNGSFRHLERKALFVGDYIDRGPEARETLRMVRSMVDADQAIALMGNHEYNAIMYNEPDGEGGFLRPRTEKNKLQHKTTLDDFEDRSDEYQSYISWFKTLPIFYEGDGFRAIHACWEQPKVDDIKAFVSNDAVLNAEYYKLAGTKGTELYKRLDTLLKGREVKLPDGLSFKDKDDHVREDVRVRWWKNPANIRFHEWSFTEGIDELKNREMDSEHADTPYYPEEARPVFFGHYWLKGTPTLQRTNVCCLDYSIGKGDKLVCYRYNGEQELDEDKLVWVAYNDETH